MLPGARVLQLSYNEARVCTTVRRAKQQVYLVKAQTKRQKKGSEKRRYEFFSRKFLVKLKGHLSSLFRHLVRLGAHNQGTHGRKGTTVPVDVFRRYLDFHFAVKPVLLFERKSKLRWQVNDCLFKSKTRSCRDYSIKSNFFLFFSDKDKSLQLDHCLVEPRISWISWGNVKFRFASDRLIWTTSRLFTDLPDSPQSSSNWSFFFFILREGFEAARHVPLSACHQLGIDLVIG